MQVTVQPLTYDEFSEARGAVRRALVEEQRRANRSAYFQRAMGGMSGLIFVAAVAGLWAFDPNPGVRPRPNVIIAFGMPLWGLLFFGLVALMAQRARSFRSLLRALVGMLAPIGFVVVISVIVWLDNRLAQSATVAGAPAPLRDWFGALAPHAGWLLLAIAGGVLTARATRRQTREAWKASPSLTRIKEFDITADGVHVDERVSERTYRWPAFVRFIETDHLLILCPSEVTFEILPKRAFESPDDLQTARAVFQAQIATPGANPPAFPVLPARQT